MTIKEQIQEDIVKMEQKFNYKFSDNEIAIKGKNIQVSKDGYTIMMLPPQDIRHFIVGHDTACDFAYDYQYEGSLFYATSEPYAGVAIIVDNKDINKKGEWIDNAPPCEGMIFMWADKDTDTLVFDSIEFKTDVKSYKFTDLIKAYAQIMPYKNVHVSRLYLANDLSNQGKKCESNQMVEMPDTKGIDYKNIDKKHYICLTQYIPQGINSIIKEDGQMVKNNKDYTKEVYIKNVDIIPDSEYDEQEISKEENDMEEER